MRSVKNSRWVLENLRSEELRTYANYPKERCLTLSIRINLARLVIDSSAGKTGRPSAPYDRRGRLNAIVAGHELAKAQG